MLPAQGTGSGWPRDRAQATRPVKEGRECWNVSRRGGLPREPRTASRSSVAIRAVAVPSVSCGMMLWLPGAETGQVAGADA